MAKIYTATVIATGEKIKCYPHYEGGYVRYPECEGRFTKKELKDVKESV